MASVGLHQQEYRHVKGGTPMHNGSPTKDSLHWYAKCIRWGKGKNPDYSNYIPHISNYKTTFSTPYEEQTND